ncbi:MAG TPA: gluconokinase [Acidobacteriota bacterium]|jgi:gluconokinase
MPPIEPSSAVDPLVVALDVGTSSTRAILYDARARQIAGMDSTVSHKLHNTADGGVELDTTELVDSVVLCLQELYRKTGTLARRVGAVATCTFWHSLVGVNSSGNAVTPVYLWADVRSRQAAAALRARLDEQQYHARTGCMFHHSYVPPKLVWLRHSRPDLLERAARWLSFGEYLYRQLLGTDHCSVSMASASGLFNQHTQDWDNETLRELPIERSQLPLLVGLQEELPPLAPTFAARWSSWKTTRWIPAVGDGATSNIGCGCVDENRLALMVGTSGAMRVCWQPASFEIVPGLWCYRADRKRILMGGALSNGGILIPWLRETFNLPPAPQLENLISKLKPDSHGLTVLPFLLGERSPEWADHARGAISGFTLQTTPVQVAQAFLEAVACRFALIEQLLKGIVARKAQVIATGGALLASNVWKQMMADALGRPILASEETEASSRGAALLALRALGVIDQFEDLPAAIGREYRPNWDNHEIYQKALDRQKKMFRELVGG